jgi:hypothetical protein
MECGLDAAILGLRSAGYRLFAKKCAKDVKTQRFRGDGSKSSRSRNSEMALTLKKSASFCQKTGKRCKAGQEIPENGNLGSETADCRDGTDNIEERL